MPNLSEVPVGSLVKLTQPDHDTWDKLDVGQLVQKISEDKVTVYRKGKRPYTGFLKDKNVEPVLENDSLILDTFERGLLTGYFGYSTGTDPEVFAIDEKGEVIPAFTFLPHKDGLRGSGKNPFWDGFQAEWNPTQNSCHAYLLDDIRHGLNQTYLLAKKLNPNANLTHECVLKVNEDLMESLPQEHVTLGCMPSLNIYNKPALHVGDPRSLPIRFAGCHVHLGVGSSYSRMAEMVRMIDRVAGVMSVSLLEGLESKDRRMFYGSAGEYRLPPHGLEYRVMSSACLRHPILTNLIFDMVRASAGLSFYHLDAIWDTSDEETRKIIDTLDFKLAREVIQRNLEVAKKFIWMCYPALQTAKWALELIQGGVSQLKELPSMEDAWALGGRFMNENHKHEASPSIWVGHCEGFNRQVTQASTYFYLS